MQTGLPGLAMNSQPPEVSIGGSGSSAFFAARSRCGAAAATPVSSIATTAKTVIVTAEIVRNLILNPPLGSVGGRSPLSSCERALVLERHAPKPALSGPPDDNKRTYSV